MEVHDFVVVIRAEYLLRFVPSPREYPYLDATWFWVVAAVCFISAARTFSPVYTCILCTLSTLAGYLAAGAAFMAGWLMPVWDGLGLETAPEAGGFVSLGTLAIAFVAVHTWTFIAPDVDFEFDPSHRPRPGPMWYQNHMDEDDETMWSDPDVMPWSH